MPDNTVHNIILRFVGEAADAKKELNEVLRDIRRLPNRKDFEFSAQVDKAKAALTEIRRRIDDLPNLKSTDIRAEVDGARANLNEIERQLRRIDLDDATVEVKARVKEAIADVLFFKGVLDALPEDHTTHLKVAGTFTGIGENVADDLDDTERSLRRVTSAFSKATKPADTFGDSVETVFTSIRRFVPLIAGFTLLIGLSLVSAFAAVGSSAVAAAGGVASFATTLIASFGPALVLVINLMQRFAQIMNVFTAAQQLQKAQFREGAKAASDSAKATATAARQEAASAQRARAIRDARQAITRAEREYQQAIADSRKEVRDAIKEQRDAYKNLRDERVSAAEDIAKAEESVRDAQADVAKQTEAAFDAIAEAATEARDAIIDLKDAQLDLADAQDEVSDLEKEIAKLLQTMGASDPGAALKKLTDVDLQGFSVDQFVAEAKLQTNPEEIEKLDDLTRRLSHAKLDLEKANNKVTDSEKAVAEANQKSANFTANGIAAFDGYVDAVNRLHDANKELISTQGDAADSVAAAQRRLSEATREANSLRAQEIADFPRVIAASEALRDAREGLAAATERANDAASSQAPALAAPLTQLSNFQFELGQLTKAERGFVNLLIAGRVALQKMLAPGTDAIFRALSRQFLTAGFTINNFKGQLNDLGKEWARQIDLFGQELFDARTVAQLGDFIDASETFTRLLGRGFRDATSAAINFAHAGLGPTESVLKQVTGSLGKLREGTNDQIKMEKVTRAMAFSLRLWLDLIGSVTAAFAEFISIVKPFGDDFVKWITEAVNGFREWMRSEEGRKQIQAFFRDTLPFAKALVTFLFKLGKVMLQVFQAIAPFLTDVFQGFNFVLDVVSALLSAFNRLPAPIRSVIVGLLPFIGALKAIPFFGKLIVNTFSQIVSVFGLLEGVGGDILMGIVNGLLFLPKAIVQVFIDAVNAVLGFLGINSPSTLFMDVGKNIVLGMIQGFKQAVTLWASAVQFVFDALFTAIRVYYTTAFNVGKTILGKIVEGVKTIGGLWVSVVAHVFGALWNAISGVFPKALSIGGDILDKIVQGVSTIGKAFDGVANKIVGGLRNALGALWDGAGGVVDIGVQLLKGIAKGAIEGIPDFAKKIGKGIVDGIGGALGIKSPAKAMVPLGKDSAAGFALGLQNVVAASQDTFKALPDKLDVPTISGDVDTGGLAAGLTEGVQDQLPKFSEIGGQIVDALGEGVQADSAVLAESAKWLNDTLGGLVGDQAQGFILTGQTALLFITQGLRTAIPTLIGFGVWLRSVIDATVQGQKAQLVNIGVSVTASIVNGARTFITELQGYGGWLKNRINDSTVLMPKVKEDLNKIGVWVTTQIVDGMKQALEGGKKNPLIGGEDGFGSKLVKAIESYFDIHSPSRLMMGIGQNITAGLLQGMNQKDVGSVIRSQLGGMVKFARGLVLNAPEWIPRSPKFGDFEAMAQLGLELWDRDALKLGSIPDRLFDEIFHLPAQVIDRYFGRESQEDIGAIIVAVGKQMRATDKEMVAAIAAALVESNMKNLARGDRDSLGVFQQRPSVKSWGTAKEIMNPFHAARKFFERAKDFRGNPFSAGELAQKVQVSAFPDRYGQRIGEALDWLARLGVKINRHDFPTTAGGGIIEGKGGSKSLLVAIGRELLGRGFQVGEHPAFGGVRPVHTKDSYHYQGRAIDINWPDMRMESWHLDRLFDELRKRLGGKIKELLWRVKDHFDHMHLAMATGGLVTGPVSALVGEGRHKEAVLPLSDAVMKRLATAIMAQLNLQMPSTVAPQISPAALSRVSNVSNMGGTTQHFNIPAVAGNEDIPPDPRLVSALIAQEVRKHGGLPT